MKIIMKVFIAFGLLIGLVGCGSNQKTNESKDPTENTVENKEQEVELSEEVKQLLQELKIDDYIVTSSHNDLNQYVANVENHSKYDLVSVTVQYAEKSQLTTEQESELTDFKDIYSSNREEPIELVIEGSKQGLVESEGKYENIDLKFGCEEVVWKITITQNQFEAMELSKLGLTLISNDEQVQVEYHYQTGEWTYKGSTTVVSNGEQKGDSSLFDLLMIPDCKNYSVYSDTKDSVSINAYSVTPEGFKAYVQKCKDAGFVNDAYETEVRYYATSEDGYATNIYYTESSQTLFVELDIYQGE